MMSISVVQEWKFKFFIHSTSTWLVTSQTIQDSNYSSLFVLKFQPMGVFAILEEECIVPKATDMTFLQKMHNNHDGKHPKYSKPKISGKSASNHHFEIAHYAGTVGYNVEGWLDKNKDPINEAVAGLFAK